MKKHMTFGALLLLVGVLVFTWTLSLMGWDITKLSTTEAYVERTFTAESNDQDITLEDKDVPVIVKPSRDGKIHITYMERDNHLYEIEEGSGITIKKFVKSKLSLFNIDFYEASLVIELPKGYAGSLDLRTGNAPITIAAISADRIDAKTSNSPIVLKDNRGLTQIKARTSNGKIVLSSITVRGNVDCMTSNGSIQLSDITADDITGVTSNASAVAVDVIANGDLSLKASNAKIKVDGITAGRRIELESSNGNITGHIRGDESEYAITSSVTNGSNSLPNETTGGDKTLDVSMKNGSIEIDFIR